MDWHNVYDQDNSFLSTVKLKTKGVWMICLCLAHLKGSSAFWWRDSSQTRVKPKFTVSTWIKTTPLYCKMSPQSAFSLNNDCMLWKNMKYDDRELRCSSFVLLAFWKKYLIAFILTFITLLLTFMITLLHRHMMAAFSLCSLEGCPFQFQELFLAYSRVATTCGLGYTGTYYLCLGTVVERYLNGNGCGISDSFYRLEWRGTVAPGDSQRILIISAAPRNPG